MAQDNVTESNGENDVHCEILSEKIKFDRRAQKKIDEAKQKARPGKPLSCLQLC